VCGVISQDLLCFKRYQELIYPIVDVLKFKAISGLEMHFGYVSLWWKNSCPVRSDHHNNRMGKREVQSFFQ
jgi:hypothetical protein